MVISEMFAASNGLGFTVVQFQRGFALPRCGAACCCSGSSVSPALLFRLVESWVLSWYHGLRAVARDGRLTRCSR